MASKLMFSFGGDATAQTPDELARERAIVDRLLGQTYAPSNVGEGLTAIGQALGARLAEGRYKAKAAKASEGASNLWNSIFNSGAGANVSAAEPAQVEAQAAPLAQAAPTPSSGGVAQGIMEAANALGIDPIKLGTAISYETAGTFDPTKAGPRTQWGQHKGLIQFGEPQAQKYGVDWNDPIGSQLGAGGAIVKYLKDAGVKPGMGLLDIYSAINAGRVGRYGASDANNGGAPGTVADKVNQQMAAHAKKAEALLSGMVQQPVQVASADPSQAFGLSGAQVSPAAAPQQMAQAMPEPSQPAQPQMQPAQGMPTAQQLLGAMQHPSFGFLPQGQQQMIVELYKQQAAKAAQQADPAYQMNLRKQALELQNLENPKMSPADEAKLAFEREKFEFEKAKQNPAWEKLSDGSLFNKLTGEVKTVPNAATVKPTDDMAEFVFSQQNPEFKQFLLDTKKAGATSVTVGGEPPDGDLRKSLDKKTGELWGEYQTAAGVSASTAQDMQLLDELIKVAPQGPVTGRLAGMFPGVSSAADAFTSVVSRVAPTLRVPGSGATSDIEYEGMLRSLPALKSKPEANAAISMMMKAKAAINMERGQIVDAYQNGEISAASARKQLQDVNKRSIMTPELQKMLSGLGSAPAQTSAPEGVDPDVWNAMTDEERALWQN